MLLEVLIGVASAVFLLVLISLVVTALTRGFRHLLERAEQGGRWRLRADLRAPLARFAAVAALALLLALLLLGG